MADSSRSVHPETSEAQKSILEGPALPGSEDDDDDSLIRWMLSLTPTRRLEVAQGFVDSILALQNARVP